MQKQSQGEGLSLEVVKKSEKEECHIIRIVETKGCHSVGQLKVLNREATLIETNLMEWTDAETIACTDPVNLVLKPFEIRTYKIK